jgi:hypothetical protein
MKIPAFVMMVEATAVMVDEVDIVLTIVDVFTRW